MMSRLWRSRSVARRTSRSNSVRSWQQRFIKLHALEIVPVPLVRLEIWHVARQALQVEAFGCTPVEEIFDRLPFVDRRAVPDDRQLSGTLRSSVRRPPQRLRR
jgi:hypothetical protein